MRLLRGPALREDGPPAMTKHRPERMRAVPPFGQSQTLARHLKIMDWLKAELVGGVAALFKAVALSSQDAITDALASVVLTTYVLGRRLGVPFAQIETRVAMRARELALSGHEVERAYGDLSALEQHFGSHGGA